MSHVTKSKNPAADCDTLLAQANGIYLEIESYYQAMQNDLSATSILQVMQKVEFLNSLMQEAQSVDTMVAEALDNAPVFSTSTSTLLERRGEILSRLYQGNRNITNRARNVQSLLRHEISSLSTNHKAINGYKPPGTDRKNIIQTFY